MRPTTVRRFDNADLFKSLFHKLTLARQVSFPHSELTAVHICHRTVDNRFGFLGEQSSCLW
jgi:hypothetical protein